MGWGEPQGASTAITTYDACPYCGQHANLAEHTALRCPRVAAINYDANGRIKRVELVRP